MEENNGVQNQVQPTIVESKQQKNNTGLIVVLILIIIVLLGYIIFTRFSFGKKQPEINTNITTNSDEIQIK